LKESLQNAKDENRVLKNLLATKNNKMTATIENLEKQKEESGRLWEELDNSEQCIHEELPGNPW